VLYGAAKKRRLSQASINTPGPPYLRSLAPERIEDNNLSIPSSPSNDRKVDMSSPKGGEL